ncbi:hypothetical protein MTR62_17135 [Novosphingobium sp. 1949]|uniref:HTH tetR-type domain-containing protein n=1 Tax=Novosphingobium organovorum TaxID=2930092 RepID=A0ABT0BH39_9SPHN|nr:hypothetical protein [Novosphingobium organovorum]MCJ2184401.1 hypothetical protein [Novosphingobium organovorum]
MAAVPGVVAAVPAPDPASSGEDRRAAIARAALTILGTHGSRGLTHRAVDRHLGYGEGTSSAYFRRRADLVEAAVRALFASDRARFETMAGAMLAAPGPLTPGQLAQFYLGLIEDVVTRMPQEARLARYECFLLASRDPATARLLEASFDTRETFDAALFEKAGAPDPHQAAVRFGYFLRGVFLTLAILPGASARHALLGPAQMQRQILAAFG